MARQQRRPRARQHQPAPPQRDRRRLALSAVAAAALLGALVFAAVAWALSTGGGGDETTVRVPAARAAGIEVQEPWADLGRIPMDTPVKQSYTLTNTSQNAVSLGEATIETLEGC